MQNARLVATEACRRARNGNHFLALVARETGLRLEVIRPEEEARLAVISCAPLVAPEAEPGAGLRHRRRLDRAGLDRPQPRSRPRTAPRRSSNLQMTGGGGGPGAARIVDFISVPLGVATLHDRYADVADDSARFALMSWFFEEQIAGFKPYLDDARPRGGRRASR